jgi:uroporphyrinogen decarboxylase
MVVSGFKRVTTAFHRVQTEHPPKGELWLGEDILKKAGFEDSLGGRLKFIKQTEQDMICLSIAQEPHVNEALGYRYFPVSAIAEVLETTDLFVMAVIDGPFQRLADKVGLMKVFTGWIRERENLLRAYEHERRRVDNLLECCLEHPVHGVVIADDIAGDQSTFFDPLIIERFFLPFYHQAVSKIHEAHAVALFHSCGNIAGIIPQLLSHGFDGLAAVQDRTNDLAIVKARYGSKLVLMGGIEAETLEKEALFPSDCEDLGQRLHLLAQNGGFILSSSCGLYSGRFLEKINAIYGLF